MEVPAHTLEVSRFNKGCFYAVVWIVVTARPKGGRDREALKRHSIPIPAFLLVFSPSNNSYSRSFSRPFTLERFLFPHYLSSSHPQMIPIPAFPLVFSPANDSYSRSPSRSLTRIRFLFPRSLSSSHPRTIPIPAFTSRPLTRKRFLFPLSLSSSHS